MTRQNLGQLRERLLRDEKVQQMIRLRAYEIYRMRGHSPGGPADDWLQAEGEVLAFLIANDPPPVDEKAQGRRLTPVAVPGETVPSKNQKPRRSAASKTASPKTTTKRATPKPSTSAKPKPKRTRKQTNPETKA